MSWWFLRSIRFVSSWVFINLPICLDSNILSPKCVLLVFGTLGMVGGEICFAKIFKDDKEGDFSTLLALESVGALMQLLGWLIGLFVLVLLLLFLSLLL